MILVGTDEGLTRLGDGPGTSGLAVTVIVRVGDAWWCVTDESSIFDDAGTNVLNAPGRINCIASTSHGVFLGLGKAGLLRDGRPVRSFEEVPGRETWYTPWGGPPDTRSIAETADGAIHVNVHVGGIPRSRDGGETWEPTIDVDADVHQVLAHPTDPDVVLAAAAIGLCVSRDGGDSYEVRTEGLHSTYSRAVALAGDTVLVTACTGPRGGEAAVYRAPITLDRPFEKCAAGLPEWFGDNVDTGCLDARGHTAAFGTADGDVYVSEDAGSTWDRGATGLPAVRALAIS